MLRLRLSLRLVNGLIEVDAARNRWHAQGGPDEAPNGLALCALYHRLSHHWAIAVREDLRVRVAQSLAGRSARDRFNDLDGQALRLSVDEKFYPSASTPLAPRSASPGADVMPG